MATGKPSSASKRISFSNVNQEKLIEGFIQNEKDANKESIQNKASKTSAKSEKELKNKVSILDKESVSGKRSSVDAKSKKSETGSERRASYDSKSKKSEIGSERRNSLKSENGSTRRGSVSKSIVSKNGSQISSISSPKSSSENTPTVKKSKLYPESLFLLEFLLEKLMVYPKSLPRQLRYENGGVCVDLNFLGNEPIEICSEEFDPMFGCPNPYNRARSGRSLLFALEPKVVSQIMKGFLLNLEVYKIVECHEDGKVKVGEANVEISSEFSEVINRIYKEGLKNPITKTNIYNTSIQGTLASAGCCVGEINLLLRITCLGKTIVTQIHLNEDDDTVLFADNNMTSMYKFTDLSDAKSFQCPGRPPCALIPSCIPKPCYTSPCNVKPCGFPTGFALCGPNPVCAPLCGMPVGSKICYNSPSCMIPKCYMPQCIWPSLVEMCDGKGCGGKKEIIPTKVAKAKAGKKKKK